MQLFQIRKMDGSKSTGIIIKIVGVSERVYNGETTIYIHYGHDIEQKVQSTDKIFKLVGNIITVSMIGLIRKLSLKNFTIG